MSTIVEKANKICFIGNNFEYKKDIPKLIDNFIVVERIGKQSVISKIVLKNMKLFYLWKRLKCTYCY